MYGFPGFLEKYLGFPGSLRNIWVHCKIPGNMYRFPGSLKNTWIAGFPEKCRFLGLPEKYMGFPGSLKNI